MDAMPWFGWIIIVAIISYTLTDIVSRLVGQRKKDSTALSKALHANTEAQAQTAQRLDAIERKLASVEKTLTDIP